MKIKHLLTKEGKELKGNEYDLYPRPQLRRESFFSLNGEWDFTFGEDKTKIIVPYPPQSILSGVGKEFKDNDLLIYSRTFTLPSDFLKERVILNIGAIDQKYSIFINSQYVDTLVSGYIANSIDITDYLEEENKIEIRVTDNLKKHIYPYGKQKHKRGGMWYTPVSGIWQSIWLESVPYNHIKSLRITPDKDTVEILAFGVDKATLSLDLGEKTLDFPMEKVFCDVCGVKIKVVDPVFWSPECPHLYNFKVKTDKDLVSSYFALRTIDVREVDGVKRLCLNGKPYFFHGLLDQGYFSDGIYTPASPDLYRQDVQKMKDLGFNTLRKHIKIEPEWFYYECDKQGMVVFQDMVNNGRYSFFLDTALPTIGLKNLPERKRTKKERDAFVSCMKSTVTQLYNHPCICYWTIFNEGWGQFSSDEMYDLLSSLDKTRIIDTNSGWFGKHKSDVLSLHVYFKPVKPIKSDLPIVLSEFGGYSYKVEGHVANEKNTYGYKLFNDQKDFENGLIDLYEREIVPFVKTGLCASILTQVTDVEDETNGLLTYDRVVCKVDKDKMVALAKELKI
ncbi:MAG: glycoside hydrolase family 2 [Clostridia bacterium]|nr:glycoside hydrolase family 2 [Clostridia bacterium]